MKSPRAPSLESSSSWTVSRGEAGLRLDKFLAAPGRLGSRGRVTAAIARGKILVNDADAGPADAGSRLRGGDVVRVWMDRPGSSRPVRRPSRAGGVQILYEDDFLLVVNKPAGLLTVPLEGRREAASAYDHLEDHLRPSGKRRPLVVHRIDRDTSGLVMFAKTSAARQALQDQFRRREPERVYWAVMYGQPEPAEGTWRDRLAWDARTLLQKRARAGDPKGVEAISHYRVLETMAGTSLVEVRLETGKQNQIRIQAGLRGHVLVGERRYVDEAGASEAVAFPRQALHAHRLSFRHPGDRRPISVEARPPADFRALLAQLRRRRE
jgi:23S rRNA pseudouridine1911/1915/1917 synthase